MPAGPGPRSPRPAGDRAACRRTSCSAQPWRSGSPRGEEPSSGAGSTNFAGKSLVGLRCWKSSPPCSVSPPVGEEGWSAPPRRSFEPPGRQQAEVLFIRRPGAGSLLLPLGARSTRPLGPGLLISCHRWLAISKGRRSSSAPACLMKPAMRMSRARCCCRPNSSHLVAVIAGGGLTECTAQAGPRSRRPSTQSGGAARCRTFQCPGWGPRRVRPFSGVADHRRVMACVVATAAFLDGSVRAGARRCQRRRRASPRARRHGALQYRVWCSLVSCAGRPTVSARPWAVETSQRLVKV